MRVQNSVICLAAALLLAVPATAQDAGAAGGRLGIELNKMEPVEGGGCRAYFLFRNGTGLSFEGLDLSLAILDSQGVIDQLLAIDAAPLPVQRTTLKLFDIPGIACPDISTVLLHDITSCRPQNAEETDCFAVLDLGSKAAADLVK